MIGIHNKRYAWIINIHIFLNEISSYGIIGDLVECLIQRSLSYNTTSCRLTYDYVKACIADPTVRKIVLIGHSQGGLVISQVLDHLLANAPTSTISKLVSPPFSLLTTYQLNLKLKYLLGNLHLRLRSHSL